MIIIANRELADMLCYSVDQMLGKSVFEFLPDEEARALAAGNLARRRQGVAEHLDSASG